MNWMIILMIGMMIPIMAVMVLTPYITRKTESFGVSIPESVYYRPEMKTMRKQYVGYMSGISVVILLVFAVAASVLSMDENNAGILFSSMIMVYLVLTFLIYLRFHHTMKLQKQAAGWSKENPQFVVVDTKFHREKLTYSNWWFLIPLLFAIVTAMITLHAYDRISDKIPMQYNFSGDVTRWADKSYRTILLMPVMQIYLTAIFMFVNIVIAKAKQQVSAEDPEKSRMQNITFRKRWSAFTIFGGYAMVLLFTLMQLSFIYNINQQVIMIVTLTVIIAIIAGALILSITTGQGGSRVKTSNGSDGSVIDRDDDRYWKLGQFYFNKNDPAIFLEKRFGVGWTNNWAHPLSWIILLAIIGIAAGLPILLSM